MELTYFTLCKLVGAAEFALAAKLYFRDLSSWRLALFAFLLADGTSNLIPLALRDPLWWRYVWMPLCFLRLGLAAVESFEIVYASRAPRKGSDRKRFLAYPGIGSAILLVSAWTWNPENQFQALDIVNQYLRLVIFSAFATAWVWSPDPRRTIRQARWWAIWLLSMFITSTKAKGGLLWHRIPWRGGYHIWLVVGAGCLLVQAFLLLTFWFSERQVMPAES